MDKKLVEFFLKENNDNTPMKSGGCTSGCGCKQSETPSSTLKELLNEYRTVLKQDADLTLHVLSEDNEAFIEKINKVFVSNKQTLTASKSNIVQIISQAEPILSIDGEIMSIKMYPTPQQLYRAVKFGEKITTESCC